MNNIVDSLVEVTLKEKDDIFFGCGVEVILEDKDKFLLVRETLTRIGIASKKEKILYQSAHILHKRGRYIICHFKELFKLDGKPTNITDNDLARRNTIAMLLDDWDLLKVINPEKTKELQVNLSQIKILGFKEKDEWELVAKYSIGGKKVQKALTSTQK